LKIETTLANSSNEYEIIINGVVNAIELYIIDKISGIKMVKRTNFKFLILKIKINEIVAVKYMTSTGKNGFFAIKLIEKQQISVEIASKIATYKGAVLSCFSYKKKIIVLIAPIVKPIIGTYEPEKK
jgi:hypothetical protein